MDTCNCFQINWGLVIVSILGFFILLQSLILSGGLISIFRKKRLDFSEVLKDKIKRDKVEKEGNGKSSLFASIFPYLFTAIALTIVIVVVVLIN